VRSRADGTKPSVCPSSNGSNFDFALALCNPDGSLDSGFGSGGPVATPIGSVDDSAEAVALQRDGKIVAAGFSLNGSNDDRARPLPRQAALHRPASEGQDARRRQAADRPTSADLSPSG
jgi:hypothetical protein